MVIIFENRKVSVRGKPHLKKHVHDKKRRQNEHPKLRYCEILI